MAFTVTGEDQVFNFSLDDGTTTSLNLSTLTTGPEPVNPELIRVVRVTTSRRLWIAFDKDPGATVNDGYFQYFLLDGDTRTFVVEGNLDASPVYLHLARNQTGCRVSVSILKTPSKERLERLRTES